MALRLFEIIQSVRHDARIQKIPAYVSLLCIFIGIGWLLLLPLDEYSRGTYVSENALLPGQVHAYFGGSEHEVFRAYRHEVADLAHQPHDVVTEKLEDILHSNGLKTAKQHYHYEAAGKTMKGQNVYGIIQGPRADATEAIVLVAAWRNMDNVLNQSGVALLLTLARYFKRWSLWSKDLIFVVTEDSTVGPQAWVDAYHSTNNPNMVDDLRIKSGALQGALALDYPAGTNGHRFDKIHVVYDGINGQLPNLDLINTMVRIASDYMGIGCTLQRMWQHGDTYKDRLDTLFRGVLRQGLGEASGPHSSFMPYHVDAITLQTVGDGWHDEMSLGRLVESGFRSLNNLLEHLHQSFFFYLLMENKRFVSIGTYLPSAMLVAVNFTIASIALWFQSGRPATIPKLASPSNRPKASSPREKAPETEVLEHRGMVAVVPKEMLATEERHFVFPITIISIAHLLGLIPFYVFHSVTESNVAAAFVITTAISTILPYMTAFLLKWKRPSSQSLVSSQQLTLTSCFSLLLLGISLSTLSTLNFSLGLIVGLLASPISFVSHCTSRAASAAAFSVLLQLFSPTTFLYLGGCAITGKPGFSGVTEVLTKASIAWAVGGTWTALVIWLVWWPAWLIGCVIAACNIFEESSSSSTSSSSHSQSDQAAKSGKTSRSVPSKKVAAHQKSAHGR